MNKTNRLLALVLALVLIVSLTACADSGERQDLFGDEPNNSATNPKASTKEATSQGSTEASRNPTEVASFSAIGNPDIDDGMVGTWISTVDLGKLMNADDEELAELGEMGEAMLAAVDGVTMDVNLELRADGSFTFGLDEQSAKEAVEAMLPALVEAMMPMIASASGMTEEQFNDYLTEQGMTMEDFTEQMKAQLNPEDLIGGLQDAYQNGGWRCVDGKLYLVETGSEADPNKYVTVERSGDKLLLTSIHGSKADGETAEEMRQLYAALLPMEFHRE